MGNGETCFENRELSWLKFNERVLEEAEDIRVPLCERLTFLSIFQSNLDEFFMVRIGSLGDQKLIDADSRDNKTHMTPDEQIKAALKQIRVLSQRRDAAYSSLMTSLSEHGISLVDFHSLSKNAKKFFANYFKTEVRPLISPYVVARKGRFPFINNKEIFAVASLCKRTEKDKIGIVPCSGLKLPRLIDIPDAKGKYILLEELILHYLPYIFPGYVIEEKTVARITRNADIDADAIYDEDLNYRDHMAEVIKRRKRLNPVRLEMTRAINKAFAEKLSEQFFLDPSRFFLYQSPLDFSFFSDFTDQLRNHSALFYASRHPQDSKEIQSDKPIIPQIIEGDKLLHYPYQSIRPFLQLLYEAGRDPSVTSIRMTLYRLARDSKVVESLVEAAENGKKVEVLVELKARFDEENNIEWSRRLERAGCKVIYGIEHLKVHSKLCLIERHADQYPQFITQIGTGNYNEKTSRLYTDLCYMTARQEIGMEALAVFEALTRGETVDHTQFLLVAPHCLQNRLLDMIEGEKQKAIAGEHGVISAKINSLSDKTIMDKLIEASQAGVQVNLIIRGINCLRSGIEGYTDNIHVSSVVGRFLEHSRIYIFGEGNDAKIYISSADWMTRNTLRRVEIACPIMDEKVKERILHIMDVMRSDNSSARDQLPNGKYVRRYPGKENTRNCQNILYDEAYKQASIPVNPA